MAITRIFRVEIRAELRDEFEPLFKTLSLSSVVDAAGCQGATLGWPTQETPDEYALISVWDDEESLTSFVGEDWTQAHIPDGMQRFLGHCWVHHFRDA